MPGNAGSPESSRLSRFARISAFTGHGWYPASLRAPRVVGWCMSSHYVEREPQPDGRAPGDALDPDAAAVRGHDGLHDGQAEPGAAGVSGARGFGPREPLELLADERLG